MIDIEIKTQAVKFRQRIGLGACDPIKIKSLLIKLNSLTAFKDLSADFSGMCLKIENDTFMLINSAHSIGRQNFTICHEIYHLFIQDDFNSYVCTVGQFDKKNELEYKADIFAAFFLMPEDGILERIPGEEMAKNKLTLSTILGLENYFGCSRSALINRLLYLKLIDADYAEKFRNNVKSEAKMYGYETGLYDKGRNGLVIGDYGKKAKQLFDLEMISESNFASLMLDIGFDVDNDVKILDGEKIR